MIFRQEYPTAHTNFLSRQDLFFPFLILPIYFDIQQAERKFQLYYLNFIFSTSDSLEIKTRNRISMTL